LADIFHGNVRTIASNSDNIEKYASNADLVISAVLATGAKAPKIITEEMVKKMRKGAVIVDIAIDQGGSVETIDRITTHAEPVYEKHGVLHYAVANIPGAVPRTSTIALTNATLPYVLMLANDGVIKAIKSCEPLAKGVNTYQGKMVYQSVAEALNLEYTELSLLIGIGEY